ncbi:MAG: hypothetical protein KDD66_04325 [Bdellovibrionales bacterium]|nr:hypothetical protein [Bdellovibrionales bacterium]
MSDLEERVAELERELAEVRLRNARVESDKAWETSLIRAATIAAITYLLASVVLWVIGAANAMLGALIPTLGYVLSVQSLPVLKRWWLGQR